MTLNLSSPNGPFRRPSHWIILISVSFTIGLVFGFHYGSLNSSDRLFDLRPRRVIPQQPAPGPVSGESRLPSPFHAAGSRNSHSAAATSATVFAVMSSPDTAITTAPRAAQLALLQHAGIFAVRHELALILNCAITHTGEHISTVRGGAPQQPNLGTLFTTTDADAAHSAGAGSLLVRGRSTHETPGRAHSPVTASDVPQSRVEGPPDWGFRLFSGPWPRPVHSGAPAAARQPRTPVSATTTV
jgi:hypothetical protein